MSGVEIAGIVLGAIPLVISALEHYEDLIDPTKAFILYRGELARAVRELGNQYASYEQSVQLLLTPITDGQELSEMLENSDSPYWKDPDIDNALRSSLGRAYNSYLRVNSDIQRVIIALAERLNIEGADKVTQKGLEAIISAHPPAKQHGVPFQFRLGERVKFSMKRQRIRKSLDELKSSIEQLDTFYAKAEKLDEPYKTRTKTKFALPLHVVQQNAARIYNVLSKTWCSSHASHSAGLLLEQRLVRKPERGKAGWRQQQLPSDSRDCNCFEISLLESLSPRKWLDVELRLVETALPMQQRG